MRAAEAGQTHRWMDKLGRHEAASDAPVLQEAGAEVGPRPQCGEPTTEAPKSTKYDQRLLNSTLVSAPSEGPGPLRSLHLCLSFLNLVPFPLTLVPPYVTFPADSSPLLTSEETLLTLAKGSPRVGGPERRAG